MTTRDVRAELEFLRDLGFTHLDLSRGAQPSSDLPGVERGPIEARSDQARARLLEGYPFPEDLAALESFGDLEAMAKRCVRCRLAGTRTQVVFGSGDPRANLMFIGEAPGRDEDREGFPFVGRAGKLLTDIIGAMKLSREEVYIANVIKCRPPENRNPEPDELEACRPWIDQQIERIAPRVIVTLGKFAIQSLIGRPVAISSVRGEWQTYQSIRVMPTYHPAFLLRNPAAKKDVWADMKKVMAELGIAPG